MKEEPVIPQNLQDLEKELGQLPQQGNLDTLLKWSQELEQKEGEGYLRDNRQLLLDQWEYIQSM